MIKVVVFGSRGFSDYHTLETKLDQYLSRVSMLDDITIISGTARGADSLGELYAKNKGYAVEQYPADWKQYGKKAGMIRNREMASVANYAVGFWNGVSMGTKGMIAILESMNVPTRVVIYHESSRF